MSNFKFDLGDVVKDKITGFKGVIMCQSRYLTGCNRYALQSQQLNNEGKPVDWQYFDEDNLLMDGENINFEPNQTGGPVRMEAPQR